MVSTWDVNKKMFEAVELNDVNGVRKMLDEKADINAKDRQGRTPLHVAIENYSGSMVRFLVLNGADVYIENSSRSTALDLARMLENQDIFQMLSWMEHTSWRPGKHPDLLRILQDKEYDDSKGKERLIQERSQIQLILKDAGLDNYFADFERHKITYYQFLRLDEPALRLIGITDVEDRRRLAAIVNDTVERARQNNILPNFVAETNVSQAETNCILKNLQTHLQDMSSSLSFVRLQEERNPDMLLHNLETTSMDDLSAAIERITDQANILIKAVNELSDTVVCSSNNDQKQVHQPGVSFARRCLEIAVANAFVWTVGAGLYLRYRR